MVTASCPATATASRPSTTRPNPNRRMASPQTLGVVCPLSVDRRLRARAVRVNRDLDIDPGRGLTGEPPGRLHLHDRVGGRAVDGGVDGHRQGQGPDQAPRSLFRYDEVELHLDHAPLPTVLG